MRTKRNRQADAGFQRDDFFMRTQLAPHLSSAGLAEPYFLDGSMGHRGSSQAGRQCELGHAAARKAGQDAYVGAIRRHRVAPRWNHHGLEQGHRYSFEKWGGLSLAEQGGDSIPYAAPSCRRKQIAASPW